jgi:hypothetical protein
MQVIRVSRHVDAYRPAEVWRRSPLGTDASAVPLAATRRRQRCEMRQRDMTICLSGTSRQRTLDL